MASLEIADWLFIKTGLCLIVLSLLMALLEWKARRALVQKSGEGDGSDR